LLLHVFCEVLNIIKTCLLCLASLVFLRLLPLLLMVNPTPSLLLLLIMMKLLSIRLPSQFYPEYQRHEDTNRCPEGRRGEGGQAGDHNIPIVRLSLPLIVIFVIVVIV